MDKKHIDVSCVEELHIPHIHTSSWFQIVGTKESIHSFSVDTSARPIGVTFFIEDLRAKTLYAHVTLAEELSQSLAKENDIVVNMYFEKNKEGFLSSILIGTTAKTMEEALNISFSSANSILSMLSFFYRRPFKIWQVHLTDSKHNIKLSTKTFCPLPANFSLPTGAFSIDHPMGSLFSLYREGMNSIDLPYRYISFFKIYEAWYDKKVRKYFFNRKDGEQPQILITNELLQGAYKEKYHKNMVGHTINEDAIFTYLADLRNGLAHPFLSRKSPKGFFAFDLFKSVEMIEAMSNLIERIATEILENELKLWAKVDEKFEKLLSFYKR